MKRRPLMLLALTLVVSSPLLAALPASAEEMVVESGKTYTAGTNNGQSGFWIDFSRKRYTKNQFYIPNPIGRYDATIQEAFAQLAGLNRALSTAEMQNLYTKYGIPLASTANYDGAAYHDFNWNATLATIKKDITAGRLAATKANTADVVLLNQLLSANTSASLMDTIGSSAIDAQIKVAFDAGNAANGGSGDGGLYTYAGDAVHTLGYTHNDSYKAWGWDTSIHYSVNYTDPAQFDQAAFDRNKNNSVQALVLNHPADFKKLTGMCNVDSTVQAGRFLAIANLVDKGLNPAGMRLDTWVNTTNGPVHILEEQPTAARLRELSRFLIASQWTTHSPIALDLNHDGKIGVTGPSTAQKRMLKNKFEPNGAVYFDIMANGKKQHIEWLKGDGDGFLVDDTNGRVSKAAGGVIDAHVLFGDAIGYSNGYHKLAYKSMKAQLASIFKPTDKTNWNALFHKKPVLKGKDLENLKIWTDANLDALVQPDEVHTLASLGISELGTIPTIRKNGEGEYVIQSYFIQRGKRFMTEDVWFAEDPATAEKN